jgi:nicotinate-nucleotide pyrophosphorylase
MTPDTAARVLSAGANLRIEKMTPDTMVRLATIARQHKVRLEIVGGLTPDSMVRVATAGGGYVLFDTSED